MLGHNIHNVHLCWTVSYRDRRGSREQLGTLWERLGSAVTPEAPVARVDKVQLRSGSSGRKSKQEQPSWAGTEGAPGRWSLSHRGPHVDLGCGAETPGSAGSQRPLPAPRRRRGEAAPGLSPGGRGDTASTAPVGPRRRTPHSQRTVEQGYFIPKNKARTIKLMRKTQETQSRSDIPGGR